MCDRRDPTLHLASCWLSLGLQGHFVRNWKRRLFVLTRDTVYYYDDNDDPDAAAKGSILLSHITGMEVQTETGAWEIKTRSHKNFNIVAASDQERSEWMQAIETAMVSGGAVLLRVNWPLPCRVTATARI